MLFWVAPPTQRHPLYIWSYHNIPSISLSSLPLLAQLSYSILPFVLHTIFISFGYFSLSSGKHCTLNRTWFSWCSLISNELFLHYEQDTTFPSSTETHQFSLIALLKGDEFAQFIPWFLSRRRAEEQWPWFQESLSC